MSEEHRRRMFVQAMKESFRILTQAEREEVMEEFCQYCFDEFEYCRGACLEGDRA